ncbi:MAG TPA: alpha/beta hydrolase [Solibacterales bacterium]|jgi:acetyl esterase/lipase|nr:alpha/beta hydrolase [Bryobacterales bacterium]
MWAAASAAEPPKTVLLWPQGAPGAVDSQEIDRPKLTIYLPEHPVGTGVVVAPGGGYGALAMDHEGLQIAKWLNGYGVAAFVLQYRLGPRYHHPAELMDAQRAIRTVRAQAAQYGIAPNRIGMWGFSAGGHLTATAGTHFDAGVPTSSDHIEQVSSRPDFLILAYPVITFTRPETHRGSMKNLLGDNPDPKLVESLSNELQVTPRTPPTFLFTTSADTTVPPENSILFYEALHKAGVPAEMHIFQNGPHGVGLATFDPALSMWPPLLANWLRVQGMLSSR